MPAMESRQGGVIQPRYRRTSPVRWFVPIAQCDGMSTMLHRENRMHRELRTFLAVAATMLAFAATARAQTVINV